MKTRTPRRSSTYAIDTALERAECETCGGQVAWVDGAYDKDGERKGGQWIHVALSDTVHPAMPKRAS